jgi:hypothetical protein
MQKKCIFACFALMQNVEIWSETKMERSENKTKKKRKTAIILATKQIEAKSCHHFCFKAKWSEMEAKNCHNFRFEAKRKRKTAIISLRSEMKRYRSKIFVTSMQKRFFWLVFVSEAKRKWNEAKTKLKKAKTSKRKRIKWNSGTNCKETKKNIKAGLLVFQVYT